MFGRINDTNANNSGAFEVTISSVPEPATWGMMIAGFGIVGLAMRRCRKLVTTRVTYA